MDLGASRHFYPINYTGEQHDPIADPIRFNCAKQAVIVSRVKDIIYLQNFLLSPRSATSLKKFGCHCYLCINYEKEKLTVTFKGETVEVSDSDSDGNVLITNFLDSMKDLFMVPVDYNVGEQRVKESTGFAGATSQLIKTNYDGVVRPILLMSKQHIAANASTITNVSTLISNLHACARFPVI